MTIIAECFLLGWLASVGSRVVYELDYRKPILYVVPIQNILGKLDNYQILPNLAPNFRLIHA